MGFCVSLFDNKLTICGLLLLWTCISSSVFCAIMIEDDSAFLLVGPNHRNQLFGVKMDTWFKWWVTAIYTFVSTAIAAFASDALCPFFTNVIEDHKTKHIPYSKFTCLLIVQVFTIYGVIMSVIGMFVALTQVDFMFIRIAADLLVNAHTTYYFLRGKEVDSELYNEWKNIVTSKHMRSCAGNFSIFDESEHEPITKSSADAWMQTAESSSQSGQTGESERSAESRKKAGHEKQGESGRVESATQLSHTNTEVISDEGL